MYIYIYVGFIYIYIHYILYIYYTELYLFIMFMTCFGWLKPPSIFAFSFQERNHPPYRGHGDLGALRERGAGFRWGSRNRRKPHRQTSELVGKP